MPRAGDAYLNGAIPITNSPLDRMDFSAFMKSWDLQAFIDQWIALFNDYLFPIIKDITGIDLSSPEAFFISLVQLIANGGAAVSGFINAIVQVIVDLIFGGITGSSSTGNPLEALAPLFSGLAGAVHTAINSANEAADVARQVMQYVVQVVQGLEDVPVFGDIFEAINSFAFWVLGWFGVTQQSVTDTNPAVAASNGRIAALESAGTVGLEGFADHFNRPDLGTDWADVTPFDPLEIVDGKFVKSDTRRVSRYVAKTLVTDTWHVQAAVGLDHGKASMFASCAPSASDAGIGDGVCLQLQHERFMFGPIVTGHRDTLNLYSISGGLMSGTLRKSVVFDGGNVKSGDVLALEYWESDNTFYVFLNNNEITGLRWIDSGNTVDHGSGHREILLMTGTMDNVFAPGPSWDDMSAYDIKIT